LSVAGDILSRDRLDPDDQFSTALSTGTFSLTTRFIALAQTFSLFRIVNL